MGRVDAMPQLLAAIRGEHDDLDLGAAEVDADAVPIHAAILTRSGRRVAGLSKRLIRSLVSCPPILIPGALMKGGRRRTYSRLFVSRSAKTWMQTPAFARDRLSVGMTVRGIRSAVHMTAGELGPPAA